MAEVLNGFLSSSVTLWSGERVLTSVRGCSPTRWNPPRKSVLLWDEPHQPLVWHTDVPTAEFLPSLPAWYSRSLGRSRGMLCVNSLHTIWELPPCLYSHCFLPSCCSRGDPSPLSQCSRTTSSPAATASGCWIGPQSALCRGPLLHCFLDPGDKSSSSLWSLPGGPIPCKPGQTCPWWLAWE